MADVLIVQNAGIEGPGNLGRLLAGDGFDVCTVHAKKEPIPTRPHDLLVVLGGPQSANDPLAYLEAEQRLILEYARMRRPVLGICLGAQLAARAFGAQVTRGPAAEVGFYGDLRPDPHSSLFSGFSDPFLAFHWHGDTFGLPDGAARLVRSGLYANQAFCIGTVVGVQFHLEVDRRMADEWIACAGPATSAKSPRGIRAGTGDDIGRVESNMAAFYRNFKSEFGL